MSSIFQIFDGHQYVWDVNTLTWVPMEQPILNAGSVTVSGTLNQGTGGSSAWKVDGSAVTQPVSGTVAVSGSVAVTGSFYQATQPVSGTFYQVTQPVSLASAPSTPITNANLDVALSTLATASAQTTGNGSLSTIATNTGNGATAANQTTGNSSLSTIATNTGLAATAAKQDTGNASVSSIDGKTPALGQALAASSVPIVLTAIQAAALTPPAAITGYALDSSLATLNATDFATQATLALLAGYALALNTAQGAALADQVGPMVQGVVNESPGSFDTDSVRPLSLTNQGRLRVSTVEADVTQVWQHTFDSPWSEPDPWQMESPYV